jgi:hypothetical protein
VLTRRAAGLFIWAEIVAQLVEQGVPDMQLDLVLGGDFGEGGSAIDNLYQQILDRAFESPKEPILRAFHSIIGVILLAKIPFQRADLQYFLGDAESDTMINFVLLKLSSVILRDGPDDRLCFRHLSFTEFLCNSDRCPPLFIIDWDSKSQALAASCLHLLNNVEDGLETSHARNEDIEDLVTCIEKSIPTHLVYSCRFWAVHLEDAVKVQDVHEGLMEAVMELLYKHLLYWLEVMSLIKEVSTTSMMLLSAAYWIRVSLSLYYTQNIQSCPSRNQI